MSPTWQVMMIRQQFWLLNFFDIFSPLEKVVNCAFPLLMVRAMSVIAFGETCATMSGV
jgi:hypothetical protein